jgi:modulator of FtsH protease
MRPQNIGIMKPIAQESSIPINQVLRNTYLLLSLTLLFSAATAGYAILAAAKPMNIFVLLIGMFGLYYLTVWLRDSRWGLAAIFAYTGFMGYTLGPIINFYIHGFSNGPQIVMSALGATGAIFLGLSAYVLVSKKNFSYLGGFISVAAIAAFLLGLAGIFFHMPILQLIISGAFAVISAAFILYTTSEVLQGGETNYIMATISIYIAIFNLFVSLLRLLSAFAGGSNRS